MAPLFKLVLVITIFSIEKASPRLIPASGGYGRDKINIIIPSAHNVNNNGPHVVLPAESVPAGAYDSRRDPYRNNENLGQSNPYDATGRSGHSYDSNHRIVQEDVDSKYRRSFISGAGSIFSGPVVIVADRIPVGGASGGLVSGGDHSSYSDSRDQGIVNDYRPTYKGAPTTMTVTESVTVDRYTTVTAATQNRVTVVHTDFSFITVTHTTKQAVRTPVNNAVSIVQSEFSQPRTIEVTNINTAVSYVTQTATETRTLVHTVRTTNFRTVTTDVLETLLVKIHQVRTSILPHHITETETAYVTKTEYVEEQNYQ